MPPCEDDYYEPNESPEKASYLLLPNYGATISVSAMICPEDHDWYTFQVIIFHVPL